ncbi:DUF2461 domain-containing protein [Turneriella parva]|uniref:DUF2461 domain-containing protein n=1 Tax=Turneriella parva TaxID=29510 RepID=UPI0012F67DC0|nr:DUF2461 domain-containing protein [Turneriella parva]
MKQSDFNFLRSLAKNNDRDWFTEHREEFETAQKNFLELVAGLIFVLSEHDDSVSNIDPKSCLFRIYRDVRFSKNKAPYKTHLAAFICADGKKSDIVPGYYVHVEPGGRSLFGAGYYRPAKPVLAELQKNIASPSSRIVKLLADKTLRKAFPDLSDDDKLARVPRGFDKNHPQAELLKLKHVFLLTSLSDQTMVKKTVLQDLGKLAEPLCRWNLTLAEIGALHKRRQT